MADNYANLTVKQLKDEAAKRAGLTIKSNIRKADLIEQLRQWDLENPADAAQSPSSVEEEPLVAAGVDTEVKQRSTSNAYDVEEPSDGNGVEVTYEANIPPVIDTAPIQMSSLPNPDKEDTPPPHYATTQPEQAAEKPVSSREEELAPVQEPATSEASPILDDPSASDIADDTRKRKQRSMTPPVEAKRVKLDISGADDDFAPSENPEERDRVEESLLEEQELHQEVVKTTKDPKELDRISKDMRRLFKTSPSDQPIPSKQAEDNEPTSSNILATDSACHVPTRALYIANLKRPLLELSLRKHLVALAATDNDEETNPIELFHLDPIKTHALILFTNTASALHVRAALHGRWFPLHETQREPLFVDFVPEEKVGEWIEKEKRAEGSGVGIGCSRWHVVYTPTGDAVHEDVDPAAVKSPPKGPRGSVSGSLGIPGRVQQDYGRRSDPVPPPRPSGSNAAPLQRGQNQSSASFKTLDELFSKTNAKPSLYYKRVAASTAAARLDALRRQTSREDSESAVHRRGEEMLRYSFEEGDRIVQMGAFHDRNPRATRGGYGERGSRRGGRDGWRSWDYRR